PNKALKVSSRSIVSDKHRTAQLLVVAQVMLSMVVLTGASLMVQSFRRFAAVALGFRSEQLLTAHVALPPGRFTGLSARSAFYDNVADRLNLLPGVEGSAWTSSLPGFEGGLSTRLSVAGRAPIEDLEAVSTADVSAGYFRVTGLPLLHGREFDSRD